MNDKELYDILYKYAEATKTDKDTAFKKLDMQPKPQKNAKVHSKAFKPLIAFAVAMSIVAIVLCVTLPLTLPNKEAPNDPAPIYCESGDIGYNQEQDIQYLKEHFGIDANYPTLAPDAVLSMFSETYENLHGASLEYVLEDDMILFVDLTIVPKSFILQIYEHYFNLPDKEQWGDITLNYQRTLNKDSELYEMEVYYTDNNYDYFVAVTCDIAITPSSLMDILYA